MMPNEERLAEIERRVRRTICPTFSSDGGESIEGRITKDDFEFLLSSLTTWKLVAKQNGALAGLTPDETCAALGEARS